jgi:four helix bundle protein
VDGQVWEGKCSRSDVEAVSKIEGGLQELEETVYWLEMLIDSGIIKAKHMVELMKEADELIAALISSEKTVKIRKNQK